MSRPITEHPCHGLFSTAGDRLTHRHWFRDNALMPTCERCGTPIDREHKEVGPVSWTPEYRGEQARELRRQATLLDLQVKALREKGDAVRASTTAPWQASKLATHGRSPIELGQGYFNAAVSARRLAAELRELANMEDIQNG